MSKPHYMTNRAPENRRGTRTHRNYIISNHSGYRVAKLATSRQAKKAFNTYNSSIDQPIYQGRVIRAIIRMMENQEGSCADHLYYGHP